MLLLLTAGMTVACSSDNDVVEAPVNPDKVLTPITITANYGDPTTRVAYTESGANISAKWETGDKLIVVFNNKVNELPMTDGAGKTTATFEGTILGSPSATSMLICYVKDKNTPDNAATINTDGSYTYADGTFLGQDGTLAGAAKRNLYYGIAQYGDGTNISCNFTVNTSMMKFYVNAPDGVSDGASATLTYKSGNTEMAQASFTVGSNGFNTIYLSIPAGSYTGEQKLVFNSEEITLSDTKASFAAGQTYSKSVVYRAGCSIAGFTDYENFENNRDVTRAGVAYTIQDGGVITDELSWSDIVLIADGATVTLHNVTLTNTSTSAIRCEGDATIILSGENDVTCSKEFNAIVIPKDHLLTIKGSGTLTATGGKFGAIGGGDPEHPDEIGTVIIENPSKVTQVTHN